MIKYPNEYLMLSESGVEFVIWISLPDREQDSFRSFLFQKLKKRPSSKETDGVPPEFSAYGYDFLDWYYNEYLTYETTFKPSREDLAKRKFFKRTA